MTILGIDIEVFRIYLFIGVAVVALKVASKPAFIGEFNKILAPYRDKYSFFPKEFVYVAVIIAFGIGVLFWPIFLVDWARKYISRKLRGKR